MHLSRVRAPHRNWARGLEGISVARNCGETVGKAVSATGGCRPCEVSAATAGSGIWGLRCQAAGSPPSRMSPSCKVAQKNSSLPQACRKHPQRPAIDGPTCRDPLAATPENDEVNMGAVPGSSAVQRPQRPDQSPQEHFKSLDARNKGYLTQSEFESSTSTISAEATRLAEQDKGRAAADFARLDGDQDGRLTRAEFEAGAHGGSRRPPPPGGAADASTSSRSSNYAAADTNQDGTVSAAEKMAAQVKSLSREANGDGFEARLALSQYRSTAALTAD